MRQLEIWEHEFEFRQPDSRECAVSDEVILSLKDKHLRAGLLLVTEVRCTLKVK